MRQHIFESAGRKIGMLQLSESNLHLILSEAIMPFIKVAYLSEGSIITIDLRRFTIGVPTLAFIRPGQFFHVAELPVAPGYLLFFNDALYGVQMNCLEGELFSNPPDIMLVALPLPHVKPVVYLLTLIEKELQLDEPDTEDMLLAFLEQLQIRAGRLWRRQHLGPNR
ncbi:hypothetical protein [Mucilaginibacter pedocola]|nr:hypothetical protein [Mucilaginibacter pedocola]